MTVVVICDCSRENLILVKELGDNSAQGRACGNLGNTHYLLGNFSQAIQFHAEVRRKETQLFCFSVLLECCFRAGQKKLLLSCSFDLERQ